jgi:hypothetical protein
MNGARGPDDPAPGLSAVAGEVAFPPVNSAALSPLFISSLQHVYDSDIDKEPDEYVPLLADGFQLRRQMVGQRRLRFVESLRTVCEAEGAVEPDEYVEPLASCLRAWRKRAQKRMQDYLTHVPEDDPLRCPVSLFGTLGLGRLETAHTYALKWLLDPRQPHGFESCLSEALLSHLLKSEGPAKLQVEEVAKEKNAVVSGEQGRIDVFATGTWEGSAYWPSFRARNWEPTVGSPVRWMLVIEAKIDASEGDRQLEHYDEWIAGNHDDRRPIRVFMTPEGRPPEAQPSDWIPFSFLDLVRVFRQPYVRLRDKPGFHFLRFFLTGILKDILRWEIPVPAAEACANPYDVVALLRTSHKAHAGE